MGTAVKKKRHTGHSDNPNLLPSTWTMASQPCLTLAVGYSTNLASKETYMLRTHTSIHMHTHN